MSDLQHRTRAGTFWAYVQNWAGRGMTLLVFFVLARLLSPGDFGAFAIATVVLTLGEVFVEFGLAHAIVQREKIEESHLSSAFWITLGLGLVLALAATIAAPILASAYGHPEIASVVRGLTPVFLLMALASVPAALLRRELNYRALAGRTALANALSGAAAITAAWVGWGVWAFVIQLNVYHLVGVVVLWRAETWRPKPMLSVAAVRQLAGFSSGMILVRMFDFAESRLLDLVVGKSAGMVGLGNYSLAARANQAQTQLIAAPMWEVAGSALSRAQNDLPRFRSMMHDMARSLSLIAMPMFVGVAIFAEPIVRIVFGKQWDTAWFALVAFSVLGTLRVPLALLGVALQAQGHSYLSMRIAALRIVAIFFWVWILPGNAPLKFALSVLFAQVSVVPVVLYLYKREAQDSVFSVAQSIMLPVSAVLVATLVALGARVCFRSESLFSVMFSASGFVIVYLVFCGREIVFRVAKVGFGKV